MAIIILRRSNKQKILLVSFSYQRKNEANEPNEMNEWRKTKANLNIKNGEKSHWKYRCQTMMMNNWITKPSSRYDKAKEERTRGEKNSSSKRSALSREHLKNNHSFVSTQSTWAAHRVWLDDWIWAPKDGKREKKCENRLSIATLLNRQNRKTHEQNESNARTSCRRSISSTKRERRTYFTFLSLWLPMAETYLSIR